MIFKKKYFSITIIIALLMTAILPAINIYARDVDINDIVPKEQNNKFTDIFSEDLLAQISKLGESNIVAFTDPSTGNYHFGLTNDEGVFSPISAEIDEDSLIQEDLSDSNIVYPDPKFSFSDSDFYFPPGTLGQDSIISSSFEIWNSGYGSVEYTILSSQDSVLSISPGSGTLGMNSEHVTIEVNLDIASLSPGTHSFSVTINTIEIGKLETVNKQYSFSGWAVIWANPDIGPSLRYRILGSDTPYYFDAKDVYITTRIPGMRYYDENSRFSVVVEIENTGIQDLGETSISVSGTGDFSLKNLNGVIDEEDNDNYQNSLLFSSIKKDKSYYTLASVDATGYSQDKPIVTINNGEEKYSFPIKFERTPRPCPCLNFFNIHGDFVGSYPMSVLYTPGEFIENDEGWSYFKLDLGEIPRLNEAFATSIIAVNPCATIGMDGEYRYPIEWYLFPTTLDVVPGIKINGEEIPTGRQWNGEVCPVEIDGSWHTPSSWGNIEDRDIYQAGQRFFESDNGVGGECLMGGSLFGEAECDINGRANWNFKIKSGLNPGHYVVPFDLIWKTDNVMPSDKGGKLGVVAVFHAYFNVEFTITDEYNNLGTSDLVSLGLSPEDCNKNSDHTVFDIWNKYIVENNGGSTRSSSQPLEYTVTSSKDINMYPKLPNHFFVGSSINGVHETIVGVPSYTDDENNDQTQADYASVAALNCGSKLISLADFEPDDDDDDIIDSDGDGVEDSVDNCPENYNPDQSDVDSDGIGDVCDNDGDDDIQDKDNDGIEDSIDNCPETYNPDQSDVDGDGIGDLCDDNGDDDDDDADDDEDETIADLIKQFINKEISFSELINGIIHLIFS